MTALRVLLIEDDANTREELAGMLEAAGHDVRALAATMAEALEAVRQAELDVAIVDLDLADGTGLEVAEAVRAARPALALVCASGDTDPRAGPRVVERTSATAFLGKPVREPGFDATLRLAVARAAEMAHAQSALDDVTRQLEARRVIHRAKEVLMRRGSSEQEAYRALQRSSQDRSTPMSEIARELIEDPAEGPSR